MRKLWLWMILLSCPLMALAKTNTPPHVIYVTLDGVRWQDVYLEKRLADFHRTYAPFAKRYGGPRNKATMEVASIPMSLPSYQSQMAGAVQENCKDNHDCPRIAVETLPESIKRTLDLKPAQVATFSNWIKIHAAASSEDGLTFVDAGHAGEAHCKRIPYWSPDDRHDNETIELALNYLHKEHPRFLWISLGDADEHAHHGRWDDYLSALAYYDQVVNELISDVMKDPILKHNTTFVITTDHGRGDGENWYNHGPDYPESKATWMFVLKTSDIRKQRRPKQPVGNFSTVDIKGMVLVSLRAL